MDGLKDVLKIISVNSEQLKKLHASVGEQCKAMKPFIRQELNEAQEKAFYAALESIISTCIECSCRMGYNTALQLFAEEKATQKPPTFPQQ